MAHDTSILVIEDDPPIRRFIKASLEQEHYRVFEADNAKRGLSEAATRKPALLILDLGLPDMDGIELIAELRHWSAMPILILSARTDEQDKIAALDSGADDYLIKPFGVGELLARVRALIRRHPAAPDGAPQVQFGEVCVDFINRSISRAGNPVHLTPIEYRLLSVLVTHPGKVMTQRQLLREVWGPQHGDDGHYLRIYVRRLRQKLEIDPAQPLHFLTETGVGYRFKL
ncbi:MAG: two-component system response regulator KdpE [Gammaproteobacteria bacterium]|nr:two-component system response regulator KdpE [Gammaproteobacteria bacterium]